MTVLAKGKYTGALFSIAKDKRKENGPIMLGSINLTTETKLTISAFESKSKNDKKYYSLSVGEKDQEHIYGALFPVENKKSDISPDYSGTIDLDKAGTERLRIVAWRRETKEKKTYLSIAISPVSAADANEEKAPEEDGQPA